MIFACDRCGRRYSVPDERIQGRPFRVTCKACGHAIQVRPGAQPPGPTAAPAPAPAAGVPAPRPPAPRAPVPAPAPVPSPRPAPVQNVLTPQRRVPVTANGLTAAEMSWLAGSVPAPAPVPIPAPAPAPEPAPVAVAAPSPAPSPAPDASSDPFGDLADGPTIDSGPALSALPPMPPSQHPVFRSEGPSSGSRFLRVLLAAALVAIALAAAGALLWPGWRARLTGGASAPAPAAPSPAPAPAPAAAPPPAATDPAPGQAAPPSTPAGKAASDPASLAPKPAPGAAPAGAGGGSTAAPRPRGRAAQPVVVERSGAPVEDLAAVPRARAPPRLAAADQQLLDLISQKRDEGAPAQAGERTDLDGARTLDPAAVERVMDESQGAFSACVSRSMKAGEPGGDVRRATLRLTVDRAGSVAAAAIAEREVGRSVLGRCLVAAARRLAFPAFEGGRVDVAVPLVLQAPR